ncbi:hypothetical protein RE628_26615 [Paenibacillus sp. D2_2]|uniref:hypothetical protein n=1 Tax=Paenibacillus sp. D2_2 TaxID=3073092 RepID=UPI0028154DF1|nr:hypothetical protein [Paenibacillus sp. D2_2]WMT40670.1 hypothetical protein RE628_26615 [Paenibacillus sp. D2_2]
MKAAVYAVRLEQVWKLMISIDIATDLGWCLAERGWLVEKGSQRGVEGGVQVERCSGMILLSKAMPLGWAVRLRDSFQSRPEMDGWKMKRWHEYIRGALQGELEQERKEKRGKMDVVMRKAYWD